MRVARRAMTVVAVTFIGSGRAWLCRRALSL
jgi:hypothetical protein